ncbi:hypothetical protein JTZ10_16250 [Gordonia rubripertincta]|uniref:Uncharacterized protein n=1 Tax=Gordonia rubripertincta TaxID=36822 RepID=A0AAW4G6I9_GORRU|nr:hypothetical protein [Gordonia rubripertincta]MBM7279302.1 hypothetical protein [Gordonia rubripertincta]
MTSYRVKTATDGRAARYRPIEVIDSSGGYRWILNKDEALRLAGDLVIAVVETGGHVAAVARLKQLADHLTDMKSNP